MGKVLSFLSNVKSRADRKRQQWILKNIAQSEKIDWDKQEQRHTVTEAAHAAQRLSVYDTKPENSEECEQYEKDMVKIEAGLVAIKENYKKENKNEMDLVVRQSEDLVLSDMDDDDEQKQIETESNSNQQKLETEFNTDEKQIETEIYNVSQETQINVEPKQSETNEDKQQTESETASTETGSQSPWDCTEIEKNDELQQIETEMNEDEQQIETEDNASKDTGTESDSTEIVPATIGDNQTEINYNQNEFETEQNFEDESSYSDENKIEPEVHFIRQNSAKESSYSGLRIQANAAHHKTINVQKPRITLNNSHNFLWLTTAIQNGLNSIIESIANEEENATELTRISFDKHLNVLPPPFRDKVWSICTAGEEMDVIWPEIYKVFADSMLIATGQYDIDDDINELMFEIRDMTEIFTQIVNIDKIFKRKNNTANWSKTTLCLSTIGARELIKATRRIRSDKRLKPSDDMAIAMLTGYTREAIDNAIFFCTRVFWELLTERSWDDDEEEEEDELLPMTYKKYSTIGFGIDTNKLSLSQRQGLNAMTMEGLFPNLILFGIDDDDDDENSTFTQYISVLE